MSDKLVECPFCAEEVKAAAIKCKHCGSMIASADMHRMPVAEVVEDVHVGGLSALSDADDNARVSGTQRKGISFVLVWILGAVLFVSALIAAVGLEVPSMMAEAPTVVDDVISPERRFDNILQWLVADSDLDGRDIDDKILKRYGRQLLVGHIQVVSLSTAMRYCSGKMVVFDIEPEVDSNSVGKIVRFSANYSKRGYSFLLEHKPRLSSFCVTGEMEPVGFERYQCTACDGEGEEQCRGLRMATGPCEQCGQEGWLSNTSLGQIALCDECSGGGVPPNPFYRREEWTRICTSCGGGGKITGSKKSNIRSPIETDQHAASKALYNKWAVQSGEQIDRGEEYNGSAAYIIWCEWEEERGGLIVLLDKGQSVNELSVESFAAARPRERALAEAMRIEGYDSDFIEYFLAKHQVTHKYAVQQYRR